MIDPLIKERCDRLVAVRLAERRTQIEEEIHQIDAKAAASGMYGSGNRLMQLHKLLARELEIRTVLSWQDMVRVHKVMGSKRTETLAEDFKEQLTYYAHGAYDELSKRLGRILEKAPTNVNLSLAEAFSLSVEKHRVEIDLYVDSLAISSGTASGTTLSTAPQYNFYGNVGAVQTGSTSSANIIQNLGIDDRQALVSALNAVKEQVLGIQDLTERKRGELKEIVEECIQQSTTQAPNNTKLFALLNILGITVQSIASAQPAYQVLKTALMPLGIMLP
ncbi:MAG: hypothetical protein PHU49_06705 [Syntrophorhabdaceae bacterium]|nr:hypothetical protein [Syntrophorhabdaceae bacterium]MDD5243691.1 hypothetical protein [Syntrophorhabdaceae bacterium]